MEIVQGDITKINADVIVNAANGIGFMGGWVGRFIQLPGVAESIHYSTKGTVERDAKKKARKYRGVPSILSGHNAGEVYVTGAGTLSANWIIHAVTMRYPGMKTSLNTVESLLPKIIREARLLNTRSLAIPLLGAGTGGLQTSDVLELYERMFSNIEEFDIRVVIYQKGIL